MFKSSEMVKSHSVWKIIHISRSSAFPANDWRWLKVKSSAQIPGETVHSDLEASLIHLKSCKSSMVLLLHDHVMIWGPLSLTSFKCPLFDFLISPASLNILHSAFYKEIHRLPWQPPTGPRDAVWDEIIPRFISSWKLASVGCIKTNHLNTYSGCPNVHFSAVT